VGLLQLHKRKVPCLIQILTFTRGRQHSFAIAGRGGGKGRGGEWFQLCEASYGDVKNTSRWGEGIGMAFQQRGGEKGKNSIHGEKRGRA